LRLIEFITFVLFDFTAMARFGFAVVVEVAAGAVRIHR
jgi:hypothetical protein